MIQRERKSALLTTIKSGRRALHRLTNISSSAIATWDCGDVMKLQVIRPTGLPTAVAVIAKILSDGICLPLL